MPPAPKELSGAQCFNPTKRLGKDDDMEFFESRGRALSLVDSLRAFSPASFQHSRPTSIPDAAIVIDGESTEAFNDPPTAGHL